MSKILILSQTYSALTFTVDLNQDSVVCGANTQNGVLIDSDNKATHKYSNINLLSIGYNLPFGFEFEGSDSLKFYNSIEFGILTGGTSTVNVLDKYIMPLRNYEMALGKFYDLTGYPGDRRFFARFDPTRLPKISMLNVPTKFDQKSFTCPVFIKFSSLTGIV